MRNGRHIFNKAYIEASRLKRTQCRFSTRTRSFYIDLHISQAMFLGFFRAVLRCYLSSKRGTLARSLEPLGP